MALNNDLFFLVGLWVILLIWARTSYSQVGSVVTCKSARGWLTHLSSARFSSCACNKLAAVSLAKAHLRVNPRVAVEDTPQG